MKILYISPANLIKLPSIWKAFKHKYQQNIDCNRIHDFGCYKTFMETMNKNWNILIDYTVKRNSFGRDGRGTVSPFTDTMKAFLMFLQYEKYPDFKILYDTKDLVPSGDEKCELEHARIELINEKAKLLRVMGQSYCKSCNTDYECIDSWNFLQGMSIQEHFNSRKCCDTPNLHIPPSQTPPAIWNKIQEVRNLIDLMDNKIIHY